MGHATSQDLRDGLSEGGNSAELGSIVGILDLPRYT